MRNEDLIKKFADIAREYNRNVVSVQKGSSVREDGHE